VRCVRAYAHDDTPNQVNNFEVPKVNTKADKQRPEVPQAGIVSADFDCVMFGARMLGVQTIAIPAKKN
jgi:hypothetical protein